MQTQHAQKTKPDTHAVCVKEKQSSPATRRQCKALDVWLDKRVLLARLRSLAGAKVRSEFRRETEDRGGG